MVAVSAIHLGATAADAGLIVASAGVAQVLADLPAGWLTGRIGERRSMACASAFVVAALALCVAADRVWMLAAGVAGTGLSAAVWGLARQAYVTDVAAPEIRARALSTLGGVTRIGMFLGPFLGTVAIGLAGTDGAYVVHLAMAVVTVVLVMRLPETHVAAQVSSATSVLSVIREHSTVLATLGVGVSFIGALRTARQVVIPLWGAQIGLDATTIALVFGISGAVDMLLFYPAGYVMDRFGRRWVAVPSMLLLSLSLVLLPLSHTFTPFLLIALLMGIGNGMGSGIIMTLGADASPVVGRAAFLSAWRLCSDAGNGVGPLFISGVTVAISLGTGIGLMGCVGAGAAIAVGRFIRPHTSTATAATDTRRSRGR